MPNMRAILVDEPGGPENLRMGEFEKPEPGDDDLLVRVHATALNRADIFQRKGYYPPPEGASPLLGLEMAGVVEAKGRHCTRWNEGDEVCALLPGGGYAEYVTVPQGHAIAVPPNLEMHEAAAVPEVFLTAYQALHWLGEMQPEERVLIHAGASGVGTAAIQLVQLAGGHAYVTASAGKHQTCLDLGAEVAIDYKNEDFAARIDEETGGQGVDIIIDFIGGPYFKPNVEALALDGRIVLLATLGGSKVDEVDLRTLFKKRARYITSTLRSRTDAYKERLVDDFAGDALPHFVDERLKPVIDSVYDWEEVAEAHRRMEANENEGKIVLRVGT